jgi:hypothetical protein
VPESDNLVSLLGDSQLHVVTLNSMGGLLRLNLNVFTRAIRDFEGF